MTLSGLTVGTAYRLQLLMADNVQTLAPARIFNITFDGTTFTETVPKTATGAKNLIIAFTASAATSPVTFSGILDAPILNGYVLHEDEQPDTDDDGVPDSADECPNSDLSTTVVIDSCNSGVTNTVFPSGCKISDLIAECAEDARNHGQFVSCVSHLTDDLKQAGTITGQQKGAIQSCAGQADIP